MGGVAFPSVDPRSEDCKIISLYERRDPWLCKRGVAESPAWRRAEFHDLRNSGSPTVDASTPLDGLRRALERHTLPCCAAISVADESSSSASASQVELETSQTGFPVSSGSMKSESGRFGRSFAVHIFRDGCTGCYVSRIIGCLSQPHAFNID